MEIAPILGNEKEQGTGANVHDMKAAMETLDSYRASLLMGSTWLCKRPMPSIEFLKILCGKNANEALRT